MSIPRNHSKGKKLSVLIICDALGKDVKYGGGSSTTFANLEQTLLKQGHQVTVLAPARGNIDYGILRDFLKDSGMRNFPFMIPTWKNLFRINTAITKADVVLTTESLFMPFTTMLCWVKQAPLVYLCLTNAVTYASINSQNCSGVMGSMAHQLSLQLDKVFSTCSYFAAHVATVTEEAKHNLIQKGYRVDNVFSYRYSLDIFRVPDSYETILETRQFLTRKQPFEHVAMYCGRISAEKRLPLLIKALPNCCLLVIVGDGPDSEVERIQALERFNVIFHRGMVTQDRLRLYYKAVDLVVSASDFETLGLIVLEASTCGTLSLVNNDQGFRTQVDHGKNGWLSDFNDSEVTKQLWTEILIKRLHKKENQEVKWDAHYPDLEHIVTQVAQNERREYSLNENMWGFTFLFFVIPFWYFASLVMFKQVFQSTIEPTCSESRSSNHEKDK